MPTYRTFRNSDPPVLTDLWRSRAGQPGLLQPVSTLEGNARLVGSIWPTTYYMHSSVGAYTKGLEPRLMVQDMVFLGTCIPILWAVSMFGLKKQEK